VGCGRHAPISGCAALACCASMRTGSRCSTARPRCVQHAGNEEGGTARPRRLMMRGGGGAGDPQTPIMTAQFDEVVNFRFDDSEFVIKVGDLLSKATVVFVTHEVRRCACCCRRGKTDGRGGVGGWTTGLCDCQPHPGVYPVPRQCAGAAAHAAGASVARRRQRRSVAWSPAKPASVPPVP
jgi:hypothetical protein